jgi:hypothetical protein
VKQPLRLPNPQKNSIRLADENSLSASKNRQFELVSALLEGAKYYDLLWIAAIQITSILTMTQQLQGKSPE